VARGLVTLTILIAGARGCSSGSGDGGGGGDAPLPARGPGTEAGGVDAPNGTNPDASGVDVAVESGPDATVVGCADGTREAFVDMAAHPKIAGCAGGFTVPGVVSNASKLPACARAGGNNGANPSGTGCSVEDLCALGWHVCTSRTDVAVEDAGCDPTPGFWLTRQSQSAAGACIVGGTNNLVGCGTLGEVASGTCTPLNRDMRYFHCADASPWSCGTGPVGEANIVVKPGPAQGGVLCCHD
jgi:hypothetical protein